MAVIGIRDLSRKTRDVLDQLEESGEPVIVARHGKPVAILSIPTPQQLDDAELAATPGFREGLDQANIQLAEGKAKSFDQFVAEVEAEQGEAEEEVTFTFTVTSPELAVSARRVVDTDPTGIVEEMLGETLVEAIFVTDEVEAAAATPGLSPQERRAMIKGAMAMRRAQRRQARAQGAVGEISFGAPEEIA